MHSTNLENAAPGPLPAAPSAVAAPGPVPGHRETSSPRPVPTAAPGPVPGHRETSSPRPVPTAAPGPVPGKRGASSTIAIAFAVVVVTAVCGTPAQQAGIGVECASNDDCNSNDDFEQTCLSFKGGYCGLEDCAGDEDCPEGSACVTHDDGENYCFLLCRDKPECNGGRSAENESNCSSNITFTDAQDDGVKACVPPSS